GDSILTSIKHTHTVGKLDNPVLPNEGYKLKLFQEISGLNSSSKFIKTKLEGLVAKRLTNSISVNLNTQSGLLLTLDGKPSLLADRFHLGGPTSVRGFRTWGLGQHDRGSSVGGDLYWSLGLSMFGKLPILNFENLKWHTFANLGKSVKFNQDSSSISQVKSHLTSSSFYKHHSSSAGIGLVYQLQNGSS
ncbi:bacterial surface antigen, partial [Conidiobolus coronatus NRRL 28638]